MLPPTLPAVLAALDFEQVQLFLAEHWHKACADPVGYAFWGLIWACAFVATFLLIRMFFTGWGDKNVTEKTLALSILVHGLVAMLSTTVMLAQGETPPKEQRTRIRRVVIEGERTRASAVGQGGRPRWDEVAQLKARSAERLNKSTAFDEATLEKTTPSTTPGIELPVSGSESPVEAAPTTPQPARVRERVPPASRIETEIDREQTATSRPEAGSTIDRTPQPSRSTDREEPPRRERVRLPSPEELTTTGPGNAAVDLLDTDPAPPGSQGAKGTTGTPRLPTATPAAEVADSNPGGEPVPGAKSSRAGSRFERTQRNPGAVSEASPTATDDAAKPQRTPEGGATVGPRDIASRTPREGSGAELSPQLSRQGQRSPGSLSAKTKMPETYRLRGGDLRPEAARKYGATADSEQAVAASLAWLAKQQNEDGSWPTLESTLGEDPEPPRFTTNGDAREEARMLAERRQSGLQAESGLTALAILAFLGAGHTPEDEQYGETVGRGLQWLVSQQFRWRSKDPENQRLYDGFLGGKANRFARMYCHGMATIALGEAYGMTRDPALREPLVRALQHTVRMQYPDGSWRYSDWRNQDSPTGDMSLFGWQLMALKSAQTAGIRLPDQGLDKALEKAQKFLAARRAEIKGRGESRYGGLASYRTGQGERPKPAMTAEALFCWQLLGVNPAEPAVQEAVDYLRKRPPRRAKPDLYYWYYATLALYQQGGTPWTEWNESLLGALVDDQRREGELAGSWDPRRPWGDFGGRVFSTAMSTLCLEVYYRYLPLYQTTADSGEKQPR